MSDPRISFANSVSGATGEQVLALLDGTVIRIEASRAAAESLPGQALLVQFATLVARLFDRVELVGDDTVTALPKLSLIQGSLLAGIRQLLPRLRARGPQREVVGSLRVAVGSLEDANLFLGCSSWTARISRRRPQEITGPHTTGALAAGCLGAAEVFKEVLRSRLPRAVFVDEYSLPCWTTGLEMGRSHLSRKQ